MKKIFVILPILAGILFGSCGISVRILTQNGLDSATLLFSRFSVAIIIMLIVILATDKNLLKISFDELKIIVIAAINILALNLCYNISTNTNPLSIAAVLLSFAPVLVIIFAYKLHLNMLMLLQPVLPAKLETLLKKKKFIIPEQKCLFCNFPERKGISR